MDEIADRKQQRRRLRRRVARWTVVMWLLIAATVADLAVYLPDARAGKAWFRPHENVIIFLIAGILIVLSYSARRETKGEIRDIDREDRQAQRETARVAELVVVQSALRALWDELKQRAEEQNHRDGRLYSQMKFAHSVAIGAITERDLERDTEYLPTASGGPVRAVAKVNHEGRDLARRLTRHLRSADDL